MIKTALFAQLLNRQKATQLQFAGQLRNDLEQVTH